MLMDVDVDGNSIDWFSRGKLQETPMIFMGKSGWFPVFRVSLTRQPIEPPSGSVLQIYTNPWSLEVNTL